MKKYDFVVVGGGIAGSVAARFSAEQGFETLLLEKRKTPRNKSCSGIQFAYFERLVGAKIPSEKLCKNEIFNVEIISPTGKTIRARMRVFNFWRSTFDRWLNDLAVAAGAEFQDEARCVGIETNESGLIVHIRTGGQDWRVHTRYMIAADGLYSRIRKQLRPSDFRKGAPGGSLNYYCVGEIPLDPNTLYMVFNRDFAPLMFAWTYLKDDQWVIGTGADSPPKEYADRFLDYMQKRYGFQAHIVRREGFVSPLIGGIYLGEDRLLFVGDAAGLIDMYRGVGMDNAALSARFAVKAIIAATRSGRPAIDCYERLMKGLIRKIEGNERKHAKLYASNETLTAGLDPKAMLKSGILMPLANLANLILPPEKIITLPL